MPSIQIAKFLGSPVKPIARERKLEPARTNAIMHDVFVAPNKDSLNVCIVKLFCKYDKNSAPTTPRDAASVAVAIPVYIDPITANINIITGKSFFERRIFSKREKFSKDLGINFLLIRDQTIT